MNLADRIFSRIKIDNYKKKIKLLGKKNKITVNNFLLSRLFIEIILFLICLLIPKYGIIISIISVIIFHYLYTYLMLDSNINIRSKELFDEALIFFQMLKLSISTTKDLRKSLEIVSNRIDNSLAYDFREALSKYLYVNDMDLIFKDVIGSNPNQNVKTALLDLEQTNNYTLTLDKIIDELQQQNSILVKQKYQSLPIVLSVLSLVYIIAIVTLLIKIPDILTYLK